MDRIAALQGTAISQVLMPTFKIFAPLLEAHSAAIKAIRPETHTYGTHPRQKVDIYTPPGPFPSSSARPPSPILIFFYGGGLTGGDKTLPAAAIPHSLAYANLGAFFATRGFTVLIPDYRRVLIPGEDAIFPSGADDLAAVLTWLERVHLPGCSKADDDDNNNNNKNHNHKKNKQDVFIMGNSAGGVHLSTFLLAPAFAAARKRYSRAAASAPLRLAGAVLLAVPFHFRNACPERAAVLAAYYGDDDAQGVERKCPLGLLLEAAAALGAKADDDDEESGLAQVQVQEKGMGLGIPPAVLVLQAERDPEDEILGPGREFVARWRETFGAAAGAGAAGAASGATTTTRMTMDEWFLKGHNHISPPIALMSGDVAGEKWAEDLVVWMRGLVEEEEEEER